MRSAWDSGLPAFILPIHSALQDFPSLPPAAGRSPLLAECSTEMQWDLSAAIRARWAQVPAAVCVLVLLTATGLHCTQQLLGSSAVQYLGVLTLK